MSHLKLVWVNREKVPDDKCRMCFLDDEKKTYVYHTFTMKSDGCFGDEHEKHFKRIQQRVEEIKNSGAYVNPEKLTEELLSLHDC
jgi:hypothetical protein